MSLLRPFSVLFPLCLVLAGCFPRAGGEVLEAAATDTSVSPTAELSLETEIDEILTPDDKPRAMQAQLSALSNGKTGIAIIWRNPQTQQTGQVIPGPGYSINGRQCRDFHHVVTVEADTRRVRGVACQTPDGLWKTVPHT